MWRHFCADCKSRKPWRRRGREVRADIKKIRQGHTAARPRSPELRAKLEQLDAEFGAVRDAFNRGDHDAVHEHLASLTPPPPGDIAQLKSYINYGGTSG